MPPKLHSMLETLQLCVILQFIQGLLGPSKSSMKVAEKVTGKKISLHSMIYNQLKAKDRRREYDSRRKASVRY
ncbi:hypothetical protein DPMN_100411 [Dreissena polymorpha]|uniref:Uncharacterized protein n=1 Tax=Dreissena polymorpha TaxID=45954 RepID=A0A9D4LH05_DREPO|nr:hypothetical protein DPMN_100411 [Dreissena polymorpha]